MVPVLDENNIPLMPCSEKRARKLMEQGKAKPYWQNGFFCIKLTVEPSARNYQKVALGIDPGSKREGYTVMTETTVVTNITTNTPDWVKGNVETRRSLRRGRGFRNTPYRKERLNRTRRKEFIPPSTKSRWDCKLRMIRFMVKLYPITDINVEDVKAVTKPGKKRWNVSFSPLETGKTYFYNMITSLYPTVNLVKTAGYDTANHRKSRGFKKSKKKLEYTWEVHNVDSHVLCEIILGKNVKLISLLKGLEWLQFHRRQLHMQVPAKGGVRKLYGGGSSLGIARGTVCKFTGKTRSKLFNNKDLYYIGGTANGKLSIHNMNGERVSTKIKKQDLKLLYISRFSHI